MSKKRPSNRYEARAMMEVARAEQRNSRNYQQSKAADRHIATSRWYYAMFCEALEAKLDYCLEIGTMTDQQVMGLLGVTAAEVERSRARLLRRRTGAF